MRATIIREKTLNYCGSFYFSLGGYVMYDVTIIGAGVVGCTTARELSKYNLKICVVEKGSDVAGLIELKKEGSKTEFLTLR